MSKASKSVRRRALAVAGCVVLLAGARLALEPRPGSPPPLQLSPQERAQAGAALKASSLSRGQLLDTLGGRRILLIGEPHFSREPQEFARALITDLHARDGRRAVLLLELPSGMQGAIDRYLARGDESELARAWDSHRALPYQGLVRWARAHSRLVSRVVACDEQRAHVFLMRLLLTDTRNATMTRAIAGAAALNDRDRVVAFGGRLHMMNAGRYMYDSPTRSPVGARLRALGIPPSDLAAIWLLAGAPPADGLWTEPGAVSFAGSAGRLPIGLLESEAVYGAARLAEVADFAVFLGPSTRIASD